MSTVSSELKAAIRSAIVQTIENMGLVEFKKTSFFGSSNFQEKAEDVRLKEAA